MKKHNKSNVSLILSIGLFVIICAISFMIIFIVINSNSNKKVNSGNPNIENKYDLVVLGTIPNMFDSKSSNGGAKYE